MIKPYKLLKGYTYSDEFTLPITRRMSGRTIAQDLIPVQPLEPTTNHLEVPGPPAGMSYRHWNMLPDNIRNGNPIRAEIYVAGWEACLSRNLHVNPYVGFNDPIMIENREAWNQGYMACMNRRTRTYTERDMEYYHTEEFLFFDVSEERYGVVDGLPYKVMLFRSIEEGNTVEGQTIYPTDYMYNFPDII